MGSRFLGRAVSVTIQNTGAPPVVVVPATTYGLDVAALLADRLVPTPPPQGTVGEARAFTGLHVRFKIEKDTLGHPNTLELDITNFAAPSRKQFQAAASTFVRFCAGYQDDLPSLPTLFQGTVRTVDSVRQGASWVTRIRGGDGEAGYRFGKCSASFRPGTPSSDIASYLASQIKQADQLGVNISAFLSGVGALQFPVSSQANGYTVTGNAFEELQKILGPLYEVSIQNGQLRALLANQTQPGQITIPLISPATGMIGSPDHGDPNLNGLPSVLKVTMLLQPRIQPGDLVQVVAAQTTGTFRVQKISHVGDLAANDWQSELELMPLGVSPS